MQINIYPVTSPIHDKKQIDSSTGTFIAALEKELSQAVSLMSEGSALLPDSDLDMFFIRTGGTENIFLKRFLESGLREAVLLTTGESNSLAAAMECLSWLNQNGYSGKIFHGTIQYIAQLILNEAKVNRAYKHLRGQRLAVIGKPSDWLIASDYSVEAIKQKLGVEVIEIPMQVFLEEFGKHDYPIDARRRLKTCPSDFFVGALEIYGALKRLVERYKLNGLTIRCFDLLSDIHNTGCLALALLNQEGIVSSCEGDVPALLTMMISQALTGETGFQANPSRIDPQSGEIVLAHCTVPLNMIDEYSYDTHFESGIGVAIKGKLPQGTVTIAKVSGDLSRDYVTDAQLTANLSEHNLCRTQIKVVSKPCADYMLSAPIGNHHIIIRGDHKALFESFMKRLSK